MTVVHIVAFSVSSPSHLPGLTAALRELGTTCVRAPTDQTARGAQPYILSLKGGRQRSNEEKDKGMQVTFVMEFENDDDLQYYLWQDEAHAKFKTRARAEFGVTDVVAMDFTDGEYDFA